MIGPRPNLLGRQAGTHKRLEVAQPILTDEDLAKIRAVHELADGAFRTATIDATWPAEEGVEGLKTALDRVCREATDCVLADNNILILSDRETCAERVPIPAALVTAAVHHHLIRQGLRMQTGLVVETGEAREVHHFCVLAGYGAEAVNPYLAFQTLEQLRVKNGMALSAYDVRKNYIKAIGKGMMKVMSKMGISTYQSYCGAQIFDAVGLSSELVEAYFTGTATTIEGVGLAEVAEETVRRHSDAYGDNPVYMDMLDVGGQYAWRLRGEAHAWTPESVSGLQHAVRGNLPDEYARFANAINEQSERLLTLRGLMRLKPAEAPLSLDEVEPASEIVKRFSTGAMSFGSISREAHTTHALGHQAGGLRPVRRDRRVSGQRRRHPDQDGPGRQARRRRPAARTQGRQEHRQGASLDTGRGPDQSAAAPRHLFDRGSGPADPRPEERQFGRPHFGEAGVGSGRRHGGRRRRQGARRSRDDFGV
jgi:glutamate synthase (NADPH/NADH) large chain